MKNVFLNYFKHLYIKGLAFGEAARDFYRCVLCAYQLILSANNRGFLGPLSISMFWVLSFEF
jgi:hypothetical protein